MGVPALDNAVEKSHPQHPTPVENVCAKPVCRRTQVSLFVVAVEEHAARLGVDWPLVPDQVIWSPSARHTAKKEDRLGVQLRRPVQRQW